MLMTSKSGIEKEGLLDARHVCLGASIAPHSFIAGRWTMQAAWLADSEYETLGLGCYPATCDSSSLPISIKSARKGVSTRSHTNLLERLEISRVVNAAESTFFLHSTIYLRFSSCAGYFKYSRLSLNPFTVWSVSLESLNSLKVFEATSVYLQSLSLTSVTVKVVKPQVSLLADEEGLLHLIALLQVCCLIH